MNKVDLWKNGIGDDSALKLSEALLVNKSLTTLGTEMKQICIAIT